MKKQQGYTLIETLVAMTIVVMLSATGLYGWQRWQQQQRLIQTAAQVQDYLLALREDANAYNHDRVVAVNREGKLWCLVSSAVTGNACPHGVPFVLTPRWSDVELVEITPALAFFGLRNTAWAGHIRLKNAAGERVIVVSSWGRIRQCEYQEGNTCR